MDGSLGGVVESPSEAPMANREVVEVGSNASHRVLAAPSGAPVGLERGLLTRQSALAPTLLYSSG
jgi:hypothetical protein